MKKILYILISISLIFFFTQKVKAKEPQTPTLNVALNSTELINKFNSFFDAPTLSYGSSTYNYINDKFIKNKLYEEYGKYYVCIGNGSAYTSHCYVSDNINMAAIKFPTTNTLNPTYNNLYFSINKNYDMQVYDFVVTSGSKSSSSKWKSTSTISDNIYSDNSGFYIKTNIKYFKLMKESDTFYQQYNSIKTTDNYYFNLDDIVVYLQNNIYKFNSEYKTTDDFLDYKAKRSTTFDKQILSYDIYVDKTDNLSKLEFKIDYFDDHNLDYYEQNNITQPKVYGLYFYGLKNENGLYHWEQIQDDCTNPDFPDEFCDLKVKYDDMYNDEILYNDFGSLGFTFKAKVDFLNIFEEYESIRIAVRLDNAMTGKIDYYDTNSKVAATSLDVNYFNFDYSRNVNHSNRNRYVLFTTKEKNISDNLYITSKEDSIFVDYFNTKLLMFTDYSKLKKRTELENTYIFRYENIGLDNALGFYILTDKNRTENLVYHFYTKPNLYFSFNNSDTLDNSIFIDDQGNIKTGDIAITPDELIDFSFNNIEDLFENIKKFNEKISEITEYIHDVLQYAYDSLNIYIKAFLITIFTIVLVCATIKLIKN